MAIDPWGGFNDANAQLNTTLTNVRNQNRQDSLDALNAQAARQSLAMGGIQLQNAQRQQNDAATLRQQLASLSPSSTTTLTPPAQAAIPPAQALGVNNAITGDYGQGTAPQSTPLTGSLDSEMQVNGLATPPTVDASKFPAEAQQAASPTVQAYNAGNVQTVTTAPDVNKVILDHALSTGDVDRINTVRAQIAAQAKNIVDITGNPMEGLKIVNNAMGTNYSIMRTPDLELVKNGDEIVAIRDKGGEKQDILNGMSLSDAVNKNMVPLNLGGSSGVVSKYLSSNPNATANDIWKLASDNNIPLKMIEPVISRLQAAENERGKDMRQERQFQHSEENQARLFAQQAKMFSERQQKLSIGMNQLNPDQKDALTKSIGAGLLDPYKINSKNQQVLADAALANPGIDLNALSAQLGAARDKGIIMKAGVAEMIPNLLRKTAEAGKALDYSDAKFIGIAEKWKNGQVNDPRLTKYMTLRNDQLLTIGGVMRSNGMTDMAQRLEEEAMHPTLAPKALDQWVEGQLESVDPRLNFYRQITKGNKGIPRSDYQPGSGAAGLYGLKDAAPKTGGTQGNTITTKGGFKVTVN